MPQFDQFSFLNQVFWLFIVFLNVYFLITYYFLPILSSNLKFRKKKILKNDKKIFNIYFEKSQQYLFLNKIFQDIISHSDSYINKIRNTNLSIIYSLKQNLLKKFNFKKNLINFYVKLNTYPTRFN